jgi:hypothetical protein
LESALFVLHRPEWRSNPKFKAKGTLEERFWTSEGLVKEFLDRLYEISLAPLDLPSILLERNFKRSERTDLLYLYLRDQESLEKLTKQHYPTQSQFFEALESMYMSDLLEEVKIRLNTSYSSKPISFSELSEGEQQLLTVFGLLRFTQQDDSLILLDEPDTHINPVWGWQYFGLLGKAVEQAKRSHFIMVTHDPLVISSLEREQVQVLRRSDEGISAELPIESPRGMGIAGILVSDIFGLRAALDIYTLERLDRKRELDFKEKRTANEEKELVDLTQELEDLRFSDANIRDPLYKPFLEAMYKNGEFQAIREKRKLEPKDYEAINRLALEIFEKVKAQAAQEGNS